MLHTQTTNNDSVCIPNVEKENDSREGWEREREREREREGEGQSKLMLTNSESQGNTSFVHIIWYL